MVCGRVFSPGCKGFTGQCLRPGDMLEVDCVKYVCDGEAKSMVPVEKGRRGTLVLKLMSCL